MTRPEQKFTRNPRRESLSLARRGEIVGNVADELADPPGLPCITIEGDVEVALSPCGVTVSPDVITVAR